MNYVENLWSLRNSCIILQPMWNKDNYGMILKCVEEIKY